MKVEKINNNKAVITLTKSDLKERKITACDIKEGKQKAQDFFFEILEEVSIIDTFDYEENQLFVEVAVTPDDSFIITITKTDSVPDIALNSKLDNTIYTICSTLYEFDCLEDLYIFSKIAISLNLYIGINSLYTLDNRYFLLFSKSTIKKASFLKTYNVLCEFFTHSYSKLDLFFEEYAKELISKNAITLLSKI